ncbi:hypothetical protein [Microbacterium gorillae]|uniref:hypothetical protein n=1 Tax=Microbacterium gorillae TaxID=1231063 RepID=UPI003D97F8A6
MTSTINRTATAVALIFTAGLGLAACTSAETTGSPAGETGSPATQGDVGNTDAEQGSSSGNAAAGEATYSFVDLAVPSVGRPSLVASEDAPFTIQFPEAVRELLPEEKRPVIDMYTLTPRTFAPGLCALEVIATPHPDGPGLEGLYGGTIDSEGTVVERGAVYGADLYGPAVELVDSLPRDEDLKDAVRGTTEDVSLTYALDDLSEAVIVKNCSTSTDDEYMRLSFGNGGLDYVSDVKPADDLFDDVVLAHYAGDVVVSVFHDGLTTVVDSTIVDAEPDVLGEWVLIEE